MNMKFCLIFLLGISCLQIWGADEVLHFENAIQEKRYNSLIEELRCPKCLNQSIADSHAGISEDLRNIVYEKIMLGKSDAEIKEFLKQRYGEFILYKPETSGANVILWYGPVAILIIAFVLIIIRMRNKRLVEGALSDVDVNKVHQLLGANSRENTVETSNTKNEELN